MKTQIFTLIIAAGFVAAPAYAQYETHVITPIDTNSGNVVHVEENRTTMPSGRTVIERRVIESDHGTTYGSEQYNRYGRYERTHPAATSEVKTTIKSTPVLMYDGIEEPLYLDDAATTETRSVTYHFE